MDYFQTAVAITRAQAEQIVGPLRLYGGKKLKSQQPVTCRCDAYKFPHRENGGQCIGDAAGSEICGQCNGSGEGMHDGSRCGYCKGSGEVK